MLVFLTHVEVGQNSYGTASLNFLFLDLEYSSALLKLAFANKLHISLSQTEY